MTRFRVEVTDTARAAITAQASYIAHDAHAPLGAQRWVDRVWEALDSLREFPRRAPLAEENGYVDYEVRELVVGTHLILFRINDERETVFVIGLRHGHRLPRPDDLPKGPDRTIE